MPYRSDAQRRFFNANRDKLEAQGVDVDEWNDASRGMKLPERKSKTHRKEANDMIEQLAHRAIENRANQAIEKVANDYGYDGEDFGIIARHIGVPVLSLTKFAMDNPDEFIWLLRAAGVPMSKEAASQEQRKAKLKKVKAGQKINTDINRGRPDRAMNPQRQAAAGVTPEAVQGKIQRQAQATAGAGAEGGLLQKLRGLFGQAGAATDARLASMPGLNRIQSKLGRRGVAGGVAGLGLAGLGLGANALLGGSSGGSAAPAGSPVASGAPKAPAAPAAAPAAPKPMDPGAGRLAAKVNKAGPAMAGIGGGATNVLQSAGSWIGKNPGKAALLGLGIPAGAYGLSRLFGGGQEDEKAAHDRFRGDRKGFLKHAHDVSRHNAVKILKRHLTKMASARDCTPMMKMAFAVIEDELDRGENINTAFKRAFPKMAAERRIPFTHRTVKAAMDGFLKEAMSSCSTKSYTGKPDDAKRWMKENS